MVGTGGVEPPTPTVSGWCSPAELRAYVLRQKSYTEKELPCQPLYLCCFTYQSKKEIQLNQAFNKSATNKNQQTNYKQYLVLAKGSSTTINLIFASSAFKLLTFIYYLRGRQ